MTKPDMPSIPWFRFVYGYPWKMRDWYKGADGQIRQAGLIELIYMKTEIKEEFIVGEPGSEARAFRRISEKIRRIDNARAKEKK